MTKFFVIREKGFAMAAKWRVDLQNDSILTANNVPDRATFDFKALGLLPPVI
jgi:hypothetical protein